MTVTTDYYTVTINSSPTEGTHLTVAQ